ncbi:hypothetical protein B0H21DRAFT_711944, partial [Amylocystis lapponica]
MTTTQWRIALEGQYFPMLLIHPPKSSRADIERLPVEPPTLKRSRKDGGEMTKQNLRCLADRVDIAVRFGVQGGFRPFDSAGTIAQWGTLQVMQDVAATNSNFWAEVVWELSIVTFRLKLLELDRTVLAKEYENDLFALSRVMLLQQIWSPYQSVCLSWCFDKRQNLLAEADWDERVYAFKRWADSMMEWPRGMELMKNHHDFQKEKLYEAWEVEVIVFYCREYHARFARLPTIPQRAVLIIPLYPCSVYVSSEPADPNAPCFCTHSKHDHRAPPQRIWPPRGGYAQSVCTEFQGQIAGP